jgi:hypothetical protein
VAGRQTDQLALIVYVTRKGAGPEAVPATIAFTPTGCDHPVELAIDVVETPPVEPGT